MNEAGLAAELVAKLGFSESAAARVVRGEAPDDASAELRVALIGCDVASIQERLLASPRPTTIRGASERLKGLDERFRVGRAVALYAGGGQATLLTRETDGEAVRREIEERFAAWISDDARAVRGSAWRCHTASVVLTARELALGPEATSVPRGVEALAGRIGWSPRGGTGFGGAMSRLADALRNEKIAARSIDDGALQGTLSPRCSECAVADAVVALRGDHRLCLDCSRNREASRSQDQARSFEEVFGERSKLIAFVRADGKGIGAVLQGLSSMRDFALLSERLKRAFERVPYELAERYAGADRYQVIMAGGDDLLMVIPARPERGDVFGFIEELIREIEACFDDLPDRLAAARSIGVGVGAVLTNGLPAGYCFDYAKRLVASAKQAVTGSPGARSAVDFKVVRGGAAFSDEIDEALKPQASPQVSLPLPANGRLRLSQRPFTAARFGELCARARRLKNVPRSTLYGLRNAMSRPDEGLVAVRYLLARRTRENEALASVLEGGEGVVAGLSGWVLRRREHDEDFKIDTAIPDLLDVARIVAADPEARRNP